MNLQKVELGTPPTGVGGDDVRTSNTKTNANVDVLNLQATLTSGPSVTTGQDLQQIHVGKRVNFNIPAGQSIGLAPADQAGADALIYLRNAGAAVTPIWPGGANQGQPQQAFAQMAPGEACIFVTDGVGWSVYMRGRTWGYDEQVYGSLTVGNELHVNGPANFQNGISIPGGQILAPEGTQAAPGISFQNDGAPDTGFWHIADGKFATVANTIVLTTHQTSGVDYVVPLTQNGKQVWHAGNLGNPVSSGTGNKVYLSYSSGTLQLTIDSTGFGAFAMVSQNNTFTNVNTFSSWTYLLGNLPQNTIIKSNQTSSYLTFVTANGAAGNVRYDNTTFGFGMVNADASNWAALTVLTLTQASDLDLKTNIKPVRAVLPLLKTKRVVSYQFKVPQSEGGGLASPSIGVIAQEWQDDFPELIAVTGTDIDADGDAIAHQYDKDGVEIYGPKGKPASRKALGFNYGNAAAVALQGVIELQEALSAALDRIAALEAKST
ncbi:tail fiber domain-containing protein [Caballeronia sp. LjRoot34]|uniref:tail fiber domain-containing protein n=1 Tax=Caballeronia sp. LjRoot34 TaxID=3342325 RepID=UPI003ED102B5